MMDSPLVRDLRDWLQFSNTRPIEMVDLAQRSIDEIERLEEEIRKLKPQ